MDAKHSRKSRTDSSQRATIALWGSSAVAALVLVLGVNGTLASWTSAIIANDTNTAQVAAAVILREVGPGPQTCFSSSGSGNSYTCGTINKYGGTSSPLAPGTSQTTDVVFSNVGTSAASSFVLSTGACAQTPTAGAGTPAAANVCTSGDLTVAVSCSDGATYTGGAAWGDLVSAATAPGALPGSLTHTATLAAGASFTCRFTVAVPAGASVLAQGVTVSQPLTWTLNV